MLTEKNGSKTEEKADGNVTKHQHTMVALRECHTLVHKCTESGETATKTCRQQQARVVVESCRRNT